MNHLTDEQLQDYLDGNIGQTDPAALHMDSCPVCRRALEQYKALYAGLESEPDFCLSADFADTVMANLPAEDVIIIPTRHPIRIRESSIAFVVLAAMVATGIWFLNPVALFQSLSGWFHSSSAGASQQINTVETFLSGYGNLPLMIFFTALAIGVLGTLDKIIHHFKGTHIHSLFV